VTDEDRAAPHPHTHHLRVQRTARYYTLGGESGDVRTVWFVVHGYGQLAGEFVRYFADLADEHSLIMAPEAMNRFYLVGTSKPASERPVGATWMTREDRASEIADYVEYLDALRDEVADEHIAKGAALNVIGFSQGAATVTRWITHGKVRPDRVIFWGGIMPPETDLGRGHAALHGARVTIVAGTRDQYIDDAVLAAERARLDAATIPHDVIRFEGGHAINRRVFAELRGDSSAAVSVTPIRASDR
jgi:predicted esterase